MEKVYEWYYTTYPMNSGAGGYSYTGAVNRSVGHLREKFFNEDSSAPLSYDELLKMKKTYEEDTIAYEKVKQDMKALKDVGQGKSEAWNELRAKEKLMVKNILDGDIQKPTVVIKKIIPGLELEHMLKKS